MDVLELSGAFVDALGIEDCTLRREFGRERGENPTLTETNKRKIDELVQKLNYNTIVKNKKIPIEEDEEAILFDIKSKPRVVLSEGNVLLKSYNSIVPHSLRRHVFLLNDVVLITSAASAGYSIFTEKLNIYHVINLNEISFIDLFNVSPTEDPCTFAIRTAERPYHFSAESESDKKIWLEELEAAIFCIMATTENKRLGWQHEIVLGTIYSAAMKGELELLSRHIDKLVGQSLDTADESGMTALHWASLFGRLEAVEMLVEAGSDVDHLNSGLNSALLLAAAAGHNNVVLYLVNKRANVFIRNIKGSDCLLMAVLHGHASPGLRNIIMALQGQGVDVNKTDSFGATPLHECASRSLSEPIQMLVDAGADVNVRHARNGLTPLQMACSVAEPDPLTVCSFLDKGAHPNWKDTAKRTAFDMVLSTHKNVKTRSPVRTYTKEAIAHISPFVQTALTTLIMLVRKGARFTEESVQHLKPSFQETLSAVRSEWERLVEPEHFVHYITAKPSNFRNFKEMPDNASEHCLLCVDKFTYSNRRHHCRGCGILCCDLCSMKKMCFTNPFAGGGKSNKSQQAPANERVCDGCFNRYSFECRRWIQDEVEFAKLQLQISREQSEAEAAYNTSVQGECDANKDSCSSSYEDSGWRQGSKHSQHKSASFSQAPSANNAPTSPTKFASFSVRPSSLASSPINTSVGLVASSAAEARLALDERGARLEDLSMRTDEMNTAAGDFFDATTKLLKEQQKNSWFGGSSL